VVCAIIALILMSASTLPEHNSIYSREEISPDGVWRVVYDYMDGERSPLIVSPRVSHVVTGHVVLDMWRSCLDGTVSGFTASGFRLTVRDPYGPSVLKTIVDTETETFAVEGEPARRYAVSELSAVAGEKIEHSRQEWLERNLPSALPRARSLWTRLKEWGSGQ